MDVDLTEFIEVPSVLGDYPEYKSKFLTTLTQFHNECVTKLAIKKRRKAHCVGKEVHVRPEPRR